MSERFRNSYRQWVIARLPADIALVIGFSLLATILIVGPGVTSPLVQFLAVAPLFVFLPGYAIVAALFPRTDDTRLQSHTQRGERDSFNPSVSPLERVACSVGVSIAVVPLTGLVVNVTLSGISPLSIALSLAGITIVSAVIAGERRAALPVNERFQIPYRQWVAATVRPDTRSELVFNIVLLLSVLALIGSFGYATTEPNSSFTEFSVLTEDNSGDLTAEGYPHNLTRGETGTVYVQIQNQEGASEDYTVVVQLQELDRSNGTVRNSEELSRFELTVPNGGTTRTSHSFTPTSTGDDLRVTYLLYRGDPPPNPSSGNAYRQVHIWINVSQ